MGGGDLGGVPVAIWAGDVEQQGSGPVAIWAGDVEQHKLIQLELYGGSKIAVLPQHLLYGGAVTDNVQQMAMAFSVGLAEEGVDEVLDNLIAYNNLTQAVFLRLVSDSTEDCDAQIRWAAYMIRRGYLGALAVLAEHCDDHFRCLMVAAGLTAFNNLAPIYRVPANVVRSVKLLSTFSKENLEERIFSHLVLSGEMDLLRLAISIGLKPTVNNHETARAIGNHEAAFVIAAALGMETAPKAADVAEEAAAGDDDGNGNSSTGPGTDEVQVDGAAADVAAEGGTVVWVDGPSPPAALQRRFDELPDSALEEAREPGVEAGTGGLDPAVASAMDLAREVVDYLSNEGKGGQSGEPTLPTVETPGEPAPEVVDEAGATNVPDTGGDAAVVEASPQPVVDDGVPRAHDPDLLDVGGKVDLTVDD